MKSITVSYPSIMKMALSSTITVSEPITLDDFRILVFKDVWEKFRNIYASIPLHGLPQDVQLWDDDRDVIVTDNSWKDCVRMRAIFVKNAL